MFRLIRRLFKWGIVTVLAVALLLLLPVGYVETFCRGDAEDQTYVPIIKDEEFQRAEANSYLTYPEWHIVYAYEGLAKVLETGDEHAFAYSSSIAGFWRAFCDLNRKADQHGGADAATRQTVHVIGVSFTFELGMKALYEETVGRLFATLRGQQKTQQDIYSARMAADYAGFLRQVPWYKYDFHKSVDELWRQPVTSPLRGWERRLALGGEWKAKAVYANVLAGAVAATGEAQLRIRSVVKNIAAAELAAIPDVDVIEDDAGAVIIETPRYRKFTEILKRIAEAGGQVVEIAGNDNIMVSAIESPALAIAGLQNGRIISRLSRDGYASNRILIDTRVADLAELLTEIAKNGRTLEHVYDY
ncbi:MAG: hypothetical protein ACR2O4_08575 [Hyphomicrobiaceae bacterium]